MLLILILAIITAIVFDFLNGMNDAANSVATIISTKVLSPRIAILWAAIFNFSAVVIFGVPVATTMGKDIIDPSIVTEQLVLATLLGAVVWVYICTKSGMPISVSHSLIGGLLGSGLVVGGVKVIFFSGVFIVALFIVLSPLIGFVLGNLIISLTLILFRKTSPRKVDSYFRVLQFLSSAVFSIGHGGNDAQKTIGIIALLLYSSRTYLSDILQVPDWIFHGNEFYIPWWVIIVSYTTISLGTLIGGWKVVKTLGVGLTDMKPIHGFAAETAGALTVIGSSIFGIPVSTTHTITGSIMGVGVIKRFSSVKWGVASNIMTAWIFTIPCTMLISALFYGLITLILWI